jgi:hypothetical protein
MYSDHPYVGLIVSYYPDNQTRYAAIVTEVHPSPEHLRPKLDLYILSPNGEDNLAGTKIKAVHDEGESLQELADRWSFAHEFLVHPDEEALEDGTDSAVSGTKSNMHVGIISVEN